MQHGLELCFWWAVPGYFLSVDALIRQMQVREDFTAV